MIEITDHGAVVQNNALRKELTWDSHGFYSASLRNLLTGQEYCRCRNPEFSFGINGTSIASYAEPHARETDDALEANHDTPQFSEAHVTQLDDLTQELLLTFKLDSHGLLLRVRYRISEAIPGIVKQLQFEATQDHLRISRLVFDTFNAYPENYRDCDHFQDADDQPIPMLFAREGGTDLICCHNRRLNEGFMVANTAPGALRCFLGYAHWNSRDVSYAMGNVPFATYPDRGETFTADQSLLMLYAGPRIRANGQFRDLVRMVLPSPPPQAVMYCTWIPFQTNICEELALQLAQHAAAMGCRSFVLDDGWFTSRNHQADTAKFPHGLAALSRSIRDLGMDFGLWFNIGTAYGTPGTPQQYACLMPDGSRKTSGAHHVLCFASPYCVLPWGCHSHGHTHHHGYEDSLSEMYAGFRQLRNELKQDFPKLLVDFSFEAFGTDTPTIAALKYSDLNHVSNYSGENDDIQDIGNIRRLFYRWLRFLPPERILGRLLVLQNDKAPEHLLTAFAGAPLVSGDLRRLSPETRRTVSAYIRAYNRLADRELLTELNVAQETPEADAFIRTGKSGHGSLAAFNRQDADVTLNIPTPFPVTDVLSGESVQRVPSQACAMFEF